jgi:hypothetical protein
VNRLARRECGPRRHGYETAQEGSRSQNSLEPRSRLFCVLAFITYTGGSNHPIATIRVNGSGLRILTRRGFNYGIDWSR